MFLFLFKLGQAAAAGGVAWHGILHRWWRAVASGVVFLALLAWEAWPK